MSFDDAPDAANQVFVYSLTAPRPDKILVLFSPKTPKAGKTFTVVVPVVQMDDGSTAVPEKLACNATLNGKSLRGSVKTAACAWRLPKSAKGKRLAFTVTVTQGSATTTFGPWRFKVR